VHQPKADDVAGVAVEGEDEHSLPRQPVVVVALQQEESRCQRVEGEDHEPVEVVHVGSVLEDVVLEGGREGGREGGGQSWR